MSTVKSKLKAADLFCGAGGTTAGLYRAAMSVGYDEVELLAINHWDVAIATHVSNHPSAKHLCENLDNVDPRKAVPSGRLDLMVASPECVHHSNARGGRPMNDQSRASAWHICRWAEALYIDSILVENVPEFHSWGPLGANGRPIKTLKGALFQNFLDALRALGYSVEHRLLNAADYGDATSRTRLFVMARRGRKRIEWPKPSHTVDGESTLFGPTQKWRAAREVIDWKLQGQSIFSRRRPLAPKTLARIAAGMKKLNGIDLEPFLVVLRGTSKTSSVNRPLPTITGGGRHFGLCEPFILPQFSTLDGRSVDRPLNTITTTSRGIGLVEPFIVPFFGEGKGQKPRFHSVKAPLPAVTSHGAGGLVEPFLVTVNHGDGEEKNASDRRVHDINDPHPTVTSRRGTALVEPMLMKYYGTGIAKGVDEPLDTVTTKQRFGLVEPVFDGYRLDIRFRMLQNHELAAAQGFDPKYQFSGNKSEVTKQIGNAVPVNLAESLVAALLQG